MILDFRVSRVVPSPALIFVTLLLFSMQVNADCVKGVSAGDGGPVVAIDGTVCLPTFDVPLSSYMSERARKRFTQQVEEARANYSAVEKGSQAPSIDEMRKGVDGWYRPKVERAESLWPVNIKEQFIGGVRTHVITPKTGILPGNRNRVLINLHGGGFEVGAILGGMAESIPVSGTAKIKVITVDYRMAPEYKFPAASEDVTSVYKALLEHYKPENIGIYGCSAGGILTAEVVAWLRKEGIPRPGAIGIFCTADAILGGDSRYTAALLDVSLGLPGPAPSAAENPPTVPLKYFGNIKRADPLVSPVTSPEILARFPPTLLISGTRDGGMSTVVHMHTQLIKAGVYAELHIWEGMGHNFIVEMDVPESQEAYQVIKDFFAKQLGKKQS